MFPHADSLVYEIETDNDNDDVYENKNFFDFSDYLEDSKLFEPVSKKLIDRMKDELKGKINSKFVGLRLKMCSLVILFDENLTRHKIEWIQSKLHSIETYDVCKISLYCFVDKRYILNDGNLLIVLLIFIKI